MAVEKRAVRDSIREVDANTWLIGDRILLSRQALPLSGPSWGNGSGSCYVVSDAPSPPPPSKPLPAGSEFRKVYDAGDSAAAWFIGDAVCKVKILNPNSTREHITLGFLHRQVSLSFAVPKVHYHAEYDGRYYIITSKIAGETLTEAWPNMDELAKQRCVRRIAQICSELSVWTGESMCGVDGRHLSDAYLTKENPPDCSPQHLLGTCKNVGMDCSKLLFYHCDLGPGNIIVNDAKEICGIIDWETAGFVPIEWIRTKFRVSGGMDLPGEAHDSRVDWRRRVQKHMEKEGMPDVAEAWMAWFKGEN
jgi:aminoglycoside phosphotransferase